MLLIRNDALEVPFAKIIVTPNVTMFQQSRCSVPICSQLGTKKILVNHALKLADRFRVSDDGPVLEDKKFIRMLS